MEKSVAPDDVLDPLIDCGGTEHALSRDRDSTEKEAMVTIATNVSPSSRNPSLISTTRSRRSRILSDSFLLLSILIMVLWPWTLFAAIRAHDGIEISSELRESILNNPQVTTIVITLLGTFNRIIATFLFGCAIVRYGQEKVARDSGLTVFGVSALLAFRHMSLMWGVGDLWVLFERSRRLIVIVALFLCLGASALIPSGTAGLLTPQIFNKTSTLTGSEVDLTSNHTHCETWLNDTIYRTRKCGWSPWGERYSYPTCIESQLNDALAAGQTNMVASIDTNTVTPRQPVTDEPLRFLGPVHGILPIGPDGFRGFNMLDNWTTSSSFFPRRMNYNYTLIQQGLECEVTCEYHTQSPIFYEAILNLNSTRLISTSGVCDPHQGLKNVLRDVTGYPTLNLNNTLTFWACARNESVPSQISNDATYYLYFRGRVEYGISIGNMTCALSTLRARDYAVTYTRSHGYFTAEPEVTTSEGNRNTSNLFLERLILAFGNLVWESQSWSANSVAESVFRQGVRYLGLSPFEKNPQHLKSYEAMIQGVFDYFAMNLRLVLSSLPIMVTAPPSCVRPVHGNVTYEVFGWHPAEGYGQVWLLLPMTLMNLASLAVCAAAMIMGRLKYRYDFEPMDTRALLTARVTEGGTESDEDDDGAISKKVDWGDGVTYREGF